MNKSIVPLTVKPDFEPLPTIDEMRIYYVFSLQKKREQSILDFAQSLSASAKAMAEALETLEPAVSNIVNALKERNPS